MNETSLIVHVSRGYARTLKRLGIVDINLFAPGTRAVRLLLREGGPSWVIGDPEIRDNYCHGKDVERTLRIASGFKFFAVRDHRPVSYTSDSSRGSTVTFLLPEEY